MSDVLTLNDTIIPTGLPRTNDTCVDQLCSIIPAPKTNEALPTSYDMRVRYPGLVGGALSQGQCSACWAFASSGALSDRIRIFSTNGTSTKTLVENMDQGRLSVRWVETNVQSDGRPLLRGQVVIPYRLYDVITIGNRRIPGIVRMSVLNALSPTYLAACDICELPFELNSSVGRYLRSRGVQCSSCCDGGIVAYAHLFMVLNGIITLSCDPLPDRFVCSSWTGCRTLRAKSVYKLSLTNYETTSERRGNTIFRTQREVPLRPDQYQLNMLRMMRDIYDNGSIVASMQTYENFKNGTSGYISLGNGLMLYHQIAGRYAGGHSVVIIGWGQANIQGQVVPYWICRNSWGINWLKNIKPTNQPDLNPGFFAILRSSNFCNIESDCYASTPFQVYDILAPNGVEKLIPENMRPSRSALEALPCRNRPVDPQGYDDVKFVSNCNECSRGDQMCLRYDSRGNLTVCSYMNM